MEERIMNQKHLVSAFFVSVVAVALFFSYPLLGIAEENGGAVQTNGGITFYEESTSSSSTEQSTTPPTPSKPTSPKPVGRYPSTGELVKASLGVSGAVLVAIVLILFYLKRKKERENTEEKGA